MQEIDDVIEKHDGWPDAFQAASGGFFFRIREGRRYRLTAISSL